MVMECGCTAGSINLADAAEVEEDQFQCHRCGEGLECPFHSSLNGLTQGLMMGEADGLQHSHSQLPSATE